MSSTAPSTAPGDSGDMVFEHTMLGLLQVGEARMSERGRSRLEALGVTERAMLPAYPTRIFRAVLEVTREELFAELPPAEGFDAVGRAFFQRYERSLMGRAVLLAIKVLGARRMLDRMSRNFRTANNYTETRVTELGPGDCEVWFNRVIEPHYYRGLLTEALSRTGEASPEVTLQSHGPEGTVFRLRWG